MKLLTNQPQMNAGEHAAYEVADQQNRRLKNKELVAETAIGFTKFSFNLLCTGLMVLTALVLTLVFWPLAVVFLLLAIACK